MRTKGDNQRRLYLPLNLRDQHAAKDRPAVRRGNFRETSRELRVKIRIEELICGLKLAWCGGAGEVVMWTLRDAAWGVRRWSCGGR